MIVATLSDDYTGRYTTSWSSHLAPVTLDLDSASLDFGFKLVSLTDTSATVKDIESGVTLTANLGEYFVSDEFGRRGLQVVFIDVESGRADFVVRWGSMKRIPIDAMGNPLEASN